jgi:predicted N-acetyltransferase YhbS
VIEVAYARLEERNLQPDQRRELSGLFPAAWLARPGVGQRGWTQQAPVARVVAMLGVPIGQASVCVVRESDPKVLGISDLVVAPAYQRLGVGSSIVREAVAVARDHHADAVLVASRHCTVRSVLTSLGFRVCRPHEFVFRRGDLVSWNETWLVLSHEVRDLVEILGDV